MRGTKTGSYTISEELGEGGMGKVYVAEHTLMGKKAAVKVLLPELSQNEEVVTRFFNEARAATRVAHAGIVDIYDFGYLEDGSAYIVMELLDGEPLTALMQRELPLAPDRVARLGGQIADALAAAHGAGIIHRDLKPDNIFIVRDSAVAGGERAKILDFGIAKLGGDNSVSLKTRTGALMGTPTYMSPEQCRGASELDWRSDIYSAGCILYELVVGRPPFVEQGLGELLAAHMMTEPPSIAEANPSVPPELASVLSRMLAKSPDDRPQSMHQVVEELRPIAGTTIPPGTTAAAAQAPGSRPGTEPTTLGGAAGVREGAEGGSRRWIAIGLAAAGTLGVAAVASAFLLSGSEGEGSARPAASAPPDAAVEESAASEPPDAGTTLAEAPPDAGKAPPEKVTISLDSSPSEAAVFDAESEERLGTTPWEHEIEREEEGELSLVVKKRGHRDEELSVALNEDVDTSVELERIRRRRQKPSSSERTPEPEPEPEPERKKERGWGEILD